MSYNRFEETTSKAKSPHGPGHSSSVLSEGKNYYRDLKQSIREILSVPQLKKYYFDKFGWSNTIFDI